MDLFYLSQVLGRPVRTGMGDRVARVKDLVARLEALTPKGEVTIEAYPPISGLVVEIAKRDIFIPWSQVQSLAPDGAVLASARIDFQHFERREGEVLLAHDIMDKQLIDVHGARVIRANDLLLYALDTSIRLTAVDVSGEGILRRLSFGRLFADPPELAPQTPGKHRGRRRRTAQPKVINWADVETLADDATGVRLNQPHDRLALLNPVDIAHILDELSYVQGADILEDLDDETAADVLEEMDEERQADIVETMDRERAADILEEMDPDNAADLLADLEEIQARDILRRMDREDAEDVEELLAYPEDSAGGMMTSDFIMVPPGLTVDETIALIRRLEDSPDMLDYLYVVEDEHPDGDWHVLAQEGGGRLIGVVSLRDILFSEGRRTLGDIMSTDFQWIPVEASPEEAARLMAEYNLIALPVLNEEERIVGVITVDDAMEVLLPERFLDRLPRVFG